MPDYDFRCDACQHRFTLFYKSFSAYETGSQARACPQCGSDALSRVIQRVNIKAVTRDFTRMSSGEMLSVFESGDSRAVGEMFDQVAKGAPELGAQYHETTQRLLKGESMDSVEKDLQKRQSDAPDTSHTPPPPTPKKSE